MLRSEEEGQLLSALSGMDTRSCFSSDCIPLRFCLVNVHLDSFLAQRTTELTLDTQAFLPSIPSQLWKSETNIVCISDHNFDLDRVLMMTTTTRPAWWSVRRVGDGCTQSARKSTPRSTRFSASSLTPSNMFAGENKGYYASLHGFYHSLPSKLHGLKKHSW